MAKRSDVPSFGVLAGVKVVSATLSTAGPFATELLAEMGADVIWVENPGAIDVCRLPDGASAGLAAESERRNFRDLNMNSATPEGKEILLRLLKDADIFIEASKGGQYDKWGLSDEVLWGVNPKLVIVHMSGFGQTGDPDFVPRGCYDPIAQSFSGLLALQGWEGGDLTCAQHLTTDYMAGYCAAAAALGAYVGVLKTGKGESVDLAQYEVALRAQAEKTPKYLNHGMENIRAGKGNQTVEGWGLFECMDGKWVYLLVLGVPITRKALQVLGLEQGNETFPDGIMAIYKGTPGADPFINAVNNFCATHTALEVEEAFWPAGVPCCRVMDYADMVDHPHYLKRGTFVQWPTVEGSPYAGQTITGVASPLRFKNNPTQIWRGCPTQGMDNDDILADAGYTAEEIAALYEAGIIRKSVAPGAPGPIIPRDITPKA